MTDFYAPLDLRTVDPRPERSVEVRGAAAATVRTHAGSHSDEVLAALGLDEVTA